MTSNTAFERAVSGLLKFGSSKTRAAKSTSQNALEAIIFGSEGFDDPRNSPLSHVVIEFQQPVRWHLERARSRK